MSREAGRTQEILEGTTDTLTVSFLVDGEPQTPTAATVEVRSPGNSILLADTDTGVSLGAGFAKLTQSWSADTYPYDEFYRAEWTITYNSLTHQKRQYFDVVRRRFESGLADSDLIDICPDLADQLPSGVTTFATWRNRAWDRIRNMVRAHTKKPVGAFAMPELLFEAHRMLTLADFHRSISRREGDVFWAQYESYQDEFDAEIKSSLSSAPVDDDQNKTIEASEVRSQRFRNWGR
tara:strand:+ start:31 stop:738 length:708 start_codon:yes stop_codon:yes gene_type:complete